MDTEDLKVEYLVLMDNEGAFCDCKESFNKLLQVSSDIKISSNKLKYKNELDLHYSITNGEVEGKDQRFFQISFSAQCNEEKLDCFVSLLKDVRTIIIKYGGQPEVLRDDISTHFAHRAYPLIHRIEKGSGSPIKRLFVKSKNIPHARKKVFFKPYSFQSPTSIPLPLFLSFSMSAFAAPVTHQDQGSFGSC